MEKPTSLIISLVLLSLTTTSILIASVVRSQLSVSAILTACPGLLTTSSKVEVYLQYEFSGPNQTVYEDDQSSISPTSPYGFDVMIVTDDRLTAGPDFNSQEAGRGQGAVTSADFKVAALAMNINYYFTIGVYNGSSISVRGRNQFGLPKRELPVVGGTGIFRCARGYAVLDTYNVDPVTLNGVVLITFYVNYNPNT